jgi:CRISPR-associated protein Csy1
MSEDEIFELKLECEKIFSLQEWLPNASSRAGQISISTHPCTFSHPSARKNKNGYVSSIVSTAKQKNDGYLRSGNVNVETDALGNAAALDVYKFLTLKMDDNIELIEHIKNDSDIAKGLLNIKNHSYDELKHGFLAMVDNSKDSVTSEKIKQVYFPVEDNNYHLLSILTNSGIVYHLRKKLDDMRFGEIVKELRDKRKNNEFSEDGFIEIYNLTTIGYGGTKPQNISVLNNKNGGKAHLLNSMPPILKTRDIVFPKRNFFSESLRYWELKETFFALDKLFKTEYKNQNIRNAKYYRYEEIIDKIIERMWAVKFVANEQYFEKNSQLKVHQKIWLLDEQSREKNDEWLDKLFKEIISWFTQSFEKVIGKKLIIYGKAETLDFLECLEKNREAFR